MDPLNIIIGINVLAQFGAHYTGAKQGLRAAMAEVKDKPKGFLQKYPPYLAALILLLVILGLFKIGVFDYSEGNRTLRITGLIVYLSFSWLQILCYKSMGDFYSQDVVVFKKHKLVTGGMYKFIRHPHYLSQILADTGAVLAVLSYLAMPFVLIQVPVLVMRAALEEKYLKKHFKDEFDAYKSKTGGFIPFIG